TAGTESGLIGATREDAELLDAIVEEAMRKRRLQAWCPSPEDFAALEATAEETGRSLNELLDQALRLLPERRGPAAGRQGGGGGGGAGRGGCWTRCGRTGGCGRAAGSERPPPSQSRSGPAWPSPHSGRPAA